MDVEPLPTHQTLQAMRQQLCDTFTQRVLSLADGQVIAWRQAGSAHAGDAVVLLHGISSGAASWLGVAVELTRLAPTIRVLAWDAPGYGHSTPLVAAAPSDRDYAQVLGQSLSLLGVRRCLLVGHSLGALIAACHARLAAAGQVQSLVLISPAGGYGAPQRALQRATVRQQRLAALRTHGVAGLAATIDQRLAAPGTAHVLRQWLRWNTARMQAAGYAQAVGLLCDSDLGRSTGQLGMPVHVWVGEYDRVTPPAACGDWARQLGARYATIRDAGHAVVVEQAAVIAQNLASLLRG